jgi:hypothetical protein
VRPQLGSRMSSPRDDQKRKATIRLHEAVKRNPRRILFGGINMGMGQRVQGDRREEMLCVVSIAYLKPRQRRDTMPMPNDKGWLVAVGMPIPMGEKGHVQTEWR